MNASYNPTEICYLCGNPISTYEVNADHIFQQQFISRNQPKAKNFDYAGILWVHKACNSMFGNAGQGPESICRKTLQLLEVLHSENTYAAERKDNPAIKIMAINSSALPEFTESDIGFFKLINGLQVPYKQLVSAAFLANKPKVNPFQIPINIALSTLAKSTSGFLVKRFGFPREGKWRILAVACIRQDSDFDLDNLFGKSKPLEVGIKLWIKLDKSSWFAAYKQNRLLVFFCFESSASDTFRQIRAIFKNASCLFFDSNKLTDLVGYDWSKNEYPL